MQLNSLYYGDCLDWMGQWDDQTVDLIYLDPPFNSQADYNVLYGRAAGGAQYRAFTDTWTWDSDAADRLSRYEAAIARPAHAAIVGLRAILGPSGMLAYLTYMAERLEHCHRLLKPTGSLYLHCDPTASHYLKVLLDTIFGHANFRNEIVWCYRGMPSKAMKFQAKHDVILSYVVSKGAAFNTLTGTPTEGSLRTFRSGRKRGYNANNSKKMVTVFDWDKYHQAVKNGIIPSDLRPVEFKGGNPPLSDWWADIKILGGPKNKERLGYATQKPLALLERIVKASSNPGDVVLDPFCGCGTTVEAANKLDRAWLGIGISPFAIDVIRERRLQDSSIPAYGIPYDLAGAGKLAAERPFAFETWAVTRLNGFVPNTKQVADGGVDGRGTVWEQPDADVTRLALAQVKGGHFNLGNLRDFNHVIDRDRAALGCYLTVDRVDTHAARSETAGMGTIRVGGMAYPRMQRWSMADYFDGLPPILPLMADPYTGKPMQMRLI